MKKIVKSGGHCYDGTGWIECSFWCRCKKLENNKCMLFGGQDGVEKFASESLKLCNKLYGITYQGEV